MGDVGDHFNALRDQRRAMRAHWIECSSPGCQFGGNPVKVPPGEPCRHCGVVAPGEKGSATRKAEIDLELKAYDAKVEAQRKATKKRLRDQLRTCTQCGKQLVHEAARRQHEIDKHGGVAPRPKQQPDDDFEVVF